MSFRDDHDAVLARADALQRERDDLAEKLASTEQERDAATREAAKLTEELEALRPIADPEARHRDRMRVAARSAVAGAAVVGALVLLVTIRCTRTAHRAKVPDAALAAMPADATPADARDIGSPPLRVDQVNAGRFWPEGGWSIRTHYTVTRLRPLPEGTATFVKLTCTVAGEHRVAVDPLGLPGAPVAIGEGAATYVDQFMWTALVPDPTRCEALVFVQMPGASPDVIDHEAARFCFDIVGPAKSQTVTATRGPCPSDAPR